MTGDNVFHSLSDGVPKGIRTPVTAVKGQCPRPLDDGDTNNPDNRISLAHLLLSDNLCEHYAGCIY